MAARSSSSRLVSHLLQSNKTISAKPVPFLVRRAFLVPRASTARRYYTTAPQLREESKGAAPPPPSQSQSNASSEHRRYTFSEVQEMTMTPEPHRLLVDVREPHELKDSGKIPTSFNLPLKTSPDFMFLDAQEFEDRFGRPRPGKDDEVIFYCRSGVRSKAAAELAKQASFGGTVSEFPGSWLEWEKNGGKVEK